MTSKSFLIALALFIASAAFAADAIKLPAPDTTGRGTIETSLHDRRSIRSFDAAPMSLRDAGQLLWSAQGMTAANGHRTAPSAGATYPLEVYLVAMNVDGLPEGVYHYRPQTHTLDLVAAGDRRKEIVAAAKGQQSIEQAPAAFVIAAVPSRTAARYAARAERYVAIEAGAAAENLALQAVALNLGTCFVGAFDDAAVRGVVGLAADAAPIVVVPAGRPRR